MTTVSDEPAAYIVWAPQHTSLKYAEFCHVKRQLASQLRYLYPSVLPHQEVQFGYHIKQHGGYCDRHIAEVRTAVRQFRMSCGLRRNTSVCSRPITTLTHTDRVHYFLIYIEKLLFWVCRSRWPRGLRRESTAARFLRLGVRIPPKAWMSVSWDLCVLSGRRFCVGPIPSPEEYYRVWCVWVWSWSSVRADMTRNQVVEPQKKIWCFCYSYEHESRVK